MVHQKHGKKQFNDINVVESETLGPTHSMIFYVRPAPPLCIELFGVATFEELNRNDGLDFILTLLGNNSRVNGT